MGDNVSEEPAAEIPKVPMKYFGILGNLPDFDGSFPSKSFQHLADLYGPIYQLELLGKKNIVLSSHELTKETFDDDNYEKIVDGGLVQIRDSIGDGLFTAYSDEKVGKQKTEDSSFWYFIELVESTSNSGTSFRPYRCPEDVR